MYVYYTYDSYYYDRKENVWKFCWWLTWTIIGIYIDFLCTDQLDSRTHTDHSSRWPYNTGFMLTEHDGKGKTIDKYGKKQKNAHR